MKIYFLCEIIRKEKRNLYRNLRGLDCSEYKSRKILLETYSLKGELSLKPARLGAMIYLKKKDWLNKEEFETGLESLVG